MTSEFGDKETVGVLNVVPPQRAADVARLAGVSKTTVGRVVNGEDLRVAEKTRARVLAAIEMLGYERNIVAIQKELSGLR